MSTEFKLENLQRTIPRDVKITLAKLPEHEFTIKMISLADDAWMLNEFGGKKGLEEVFTTADFRSIVRIFYRFISDECKQVVTSMEFNTVDEDGVKVPVTKNIEKLCYLISTDELEKIILKMLEVRGLSMPEPTTGEESDEGKNL